MLRSQVNQSDVCVCRRACCVIEREHNFISCSFILILQCLWFRSLILILGCSHSATSFSPRTNSPPRTTRFIRFHLFSSSALSLADSRIVVKVHRHANLKHMDTTWNGNRFVTPIEYTIFAPETQTHTLFVLFVAKQPPHTKCVHDLHTVCMGVCVSECILCQTDNGNDADADDVMVIILFVTR